MIGQLYIRMLKVFLFIIRRFLLMLSVDVLLKDGNFNVLVEVLVVVLNLLFQKFFLYCMLFLVIFEVVEEGFVEEDEVVVVVFEVVFKGIGEGLVEVIEEDLVEGMIEEVLLDEVVFEGVFKIEEIVVLVDLVNNREGLVVQEVQVDMVDREEGMVVVVVVLGKFLFDMYCLFVVLISQQWFWLVKWSLRWIRWRRFWGGWRL